MENFANRQILTEYFVPQHVRDLNPVPRESETYLRTGLQTLHGSIWSLNASTPQLNFDFDEDPDFEFDAHSDSDPAFLSGADPDPGSQN
jgi:hypothetical protein